MSKLIIDEEEFIRVCEESSTAAQAAKKLNMHFNTFKRHAQKLDCYKTNQGGKGVKEDYDRSNRVNTEDILNGMFPQYQTYKLKIRLIDEGYLQDKCSICGWGEKRPGERLSTCELHHIDGNDSNHSLSNLVLLCPNCHSLTPNYRGKKKSSYVGNSQLNDG